MVTGPISSENLTWVARMTADEQKTTDKIAV